MRLGRLLPHPGIELRTRDIGGVCGSGQNTTKNWHPKKNAERDTLGVFC